MLLISFSLSATCSVWLMLCNCDSWLLCFVCVQESLLEECLTTVQLYAIHLLVRQGSIDSLVEELSSELLEAGVNHCSSSLNSIYPLQLRRAVVNQLTIKGVQ